MFRKISKQKNDRATNCSRIIEANRERAATNDYKKVQKLRRVWCEGSFGTMKTKHNLFKTSEPLSFFRLHGGQDQNNFLKGVIGATEWFYFIKESFDNTLYVDTLNDLKVNLIAWENSYSYIVKIVNQLALDKNFLEENKNLIDELNKCYNECLSIINS